MQPVAVPRYRRELTRREEWRLCHAPRIARALFVAGVFTLIGLCAGDDVVHVVDALPWHPWRSHQWLVCYGKSDTFIAVYTQYPGYCAAALQAPSDCAATCETRVGHTTWDVCERSCPGARLARVW